MSNEPEVREGQQEEQAAPVADDVIDVRLHVDLSRMLWKDWRLVRQMQALKGKPLNGDQVMALMELIDRVTIAVEGVESIDEMPAGDVVALFLDTLTSEASGSVKN